MADHNQEPEKSRIEQQLRRLREAMVKEVERGRLFGLDQRVRQLQRDTNLLTRI